jgi:hypothetical protein
MRHNPAVTNKTAKAVRRAHALRLRAARGIGWRLQRAGVRLGSRAVTGGLIESRGDSLEASTLLRNGWTAPPVDVLFYFPDTVSKFYQLQQWLPVIRANHTDLRFGIVTRARSTWTQLMADDLPAPSFLAMPFPSLMDLYRVLKPKAIVYPNNGLRNFQSLIWAEAAHIHVNHGESDKVSMVSNQAKAYDRVFVAGEAAVRRHRAALVGFDESRLVRVGRPQLDLIPPPALAPSARRTILYAPTWEGEDESNNFTSVDVYGPQLMTSLLGIPDCRVIYKPHPRVVSSTAARIAAAHQAIVASLTGAAEADPAAGHAYRPEGDVLALFPRVDLLVTDISSVGLDFLYSRPTTPIALTDRRNDRNELQREAPISAGSHVIDSQSIATAAADLAALLADDVLAEQRTLLRRFYFDDVAAGESTRKFHEALRATIDEHRAGLAETHRLAETGTWREWLAEG